MEKRTMSEQLAQDAVTTALKAAPGLAVVATSATGTINWSDVAYMLTAGYMLLQIVLLIPKYRQMLRDWRNRKKGC